MCGIFGIISKDKVYYRLVKGAERLQNRGEHSTGIATYDGQFFYHHKGLGPATIVFHNYDIKQLKGKAGIVHTRYATTGGHSKEKLERNIQPVSNERPGMFTCANGDLINVHSQREKLKEQGFSFQTEVDAKVIQDTLIYHLIENRIYKIKNTEDYVNALFLSLENVHSELVGAYSALTLMEKGLFVFKDPHGIRPLSMAMRKFYGDVIEYAFASESTVFNYFGDYEEITELKGGECVFVEYDTLKVYKTRLQNSRDTFCFFEFIYFARPDSKFKGRVVEVVRQETGRILAREYGYMKDKIDVVIGIPGTGISAGHTFAQCLGLPYENAIIKVGTKRSFQETSYERRKQAIDEKFVFIKDFINGRRVAVVDDSNVRGTTGKNLSKRLFNLGAKEVHLFYFCPAVIGPCFYGIDTPDEKELIAAARTIEEIRQMMNVTSVNYISLEGMIEALKIPRDELCLACITRDYPTSTEEIQQRLALRKKDRSEKSC